MSREFCAQIGYWWWRRRSTAVLPALFRRSHPLALLFRDKQAKVRLMGHNKGRDNARKRSKRRKKTERLALAKQKQSKK